MAFLINGNPIITNDRDLSAVGVATLTEDINIGRLLYDANGNVGAADSVLVTKDNTLQWVAPSSIGISTGSALAPGSTYFVTENGDDSNSGDSLNNAWASIGYALQNITVSGDDVLYIGAGDYTESFPLTVPKGLTVKGAGQRATIIRPTTATETNNGFLLNDDTTMEDFSIGDMFKPQGAANNSYAFSYEVGAAITSRSPYISRVSIINRGSNVTASDPYGFDSNDNYPVSAPGAGGVNVDGADLAASSVAGSFLLNEVTIFPVANKGVNMTNGARVEMLNTFIYFADDAVTGESDLSTGLASAGRARLTLFNASSTPVATDTIEYYDTDGTTVLASGTIDEVSGDYVYLNGSGTGEFEVPRNRTPVAVNFVNGAVLSNTQTKFGSTSLDVTSSNSDAVTAETAGFGFGTGEFTVEGWVYITGFSSNKYIWDFRGTLATDQRVVLEEGSAGDLLVNIGTTNILATSGAPLSLNTWHHVAVVRGATNMEIYVDGTLEDSAANSTDLGVSGNLHLGADYTDANGTTAFIDDFRVEKGVAKYTGAFTAPTAPLAGDKDTSILLNFDGTPGDTSTTDDIIVNQDIRFTGGNTADRLTLADYQEFGADLRSIGCAVEYGNRGVIGDGQGVTLRLISINFNHVGAGGDSSNDPNLVIQANEITELNSAEVSYVSIDQKGDFRVGESFYVDQENGTVSFNQTTTDLTSLSSLTITNGTDSSVITPTSGRFGNVQISGNQIESTTGDLNLNTAGSGDVNINANVNITGIISASSINLAAVQNGDTSIALDDTGSDGTIRFITDGSEAGRFTNGNDLEVVGSIKTGAGESVTSGFYYGDGSNLSGVLSEDGGGNADLTGNLQVGSIEVTGPGIALTVTNDVAIGGSVSVGGTAYINDLVLTEVLDFVGANQAVIGVATITGDLIAQGNIIGDGATNISGIDTVTATAYYGSGEFLTDISAGSVDLTGTDQSFNSLELTGPGIALTVTNDVAIGGTVSVTETIFAQGYDSLSDEKLKDDIFTLEDALGSLDGLRGVSYVWKKNGKQSIGVVAQELQQVYPELVTEGENLTVNYNGLVGVLLRAVKELNAKVEDLQRQLDEK